eukprot:TRINITY_DN7209_c0_g5_i2.p1 TRINITY_DN7209_c0_g5~~TRINITY_DN7209_c0_g5_i2.p1  ORF type:complete len:182 (+),score=1.22 TRINITY_DN7209_c0_g5_i2:63-608(+)
MATNENVASPSTKKRISKELKAASSNSDMLIFPSVTDDMFWHAIISGPKGSLYEGGNWVLSVKFPHNYPFFPPNVTFLTPFLHVNANASGKLCVDILLDNWSPALTIEKVLLVFVGVMADPNPDDPLDTELASRFRSNFEAYQQEIRDHVRQYASASVEQLKLAFSLHHVVPPDTSPPAAP